MTKKYTIMGQLYDPEREADMSIVGVGASTPNLRLNGMEVKPAGLNEPVAAEALDGESAQAGSAEKWRSDRVDISNEGRRSAQALFASLDKTKAQDNTRAQDKVGRAPDNIDYSSPQICPMKENVDPQGRDEKVGGQPGSAPWAPAGGPQKAGGGNPEAMKKKLEELKKELKELTSEIERLKRESGDGAGEEEIKTKEAEKQHLEAQIKSMEQQVKG